jgi:hypothetical protein
MQIVTASLQGLPLEKSIADSALLSLDLHG